MSQQVNANPDDLERFARELKQYNDYLRDRTSRLHGQFRRLEENWRDQQHLRFATEFEQTRRQVERYLKTADPYVHFLKKEAQNLRAYLQHNVGG